jgi:hypothetical protein
MKLGIALLVMVASCGGDGESIDVCVAGCEATIAAACSNGPATQASCEADCNQLREGACAAEYEALLGCSDDAAVTCSPNGQPVVEACSVEQSAFVACLSP